MVGRAGWLARRPIRTRIALAAALVAGTAFAVAGLALLVLVRDALERPVRGEARVRAADVVALAKNGVLPAEIPPFAAQWPTLAQVIGPDGGVIAASRELVGRSELLTVPELGREPTGQARLTYSGRTERFRVDAVFAGTGKGPVTVLVATSLAQVDRSASLIGAGLALGVPLLAGLVAATAWFVVGRSLRPVEAMRAEVAGFDVTGRRVRLEEPVTDDELGRLAQTLNAMLDRLEAAGDQQRRFVADASHELRSPVAAIRTALDVALAHPASRPWPLVARDVAAANDRMGRLVDDLLTLARSESGQLARRDEPVDFDVIVAETIDAVSAVPVDGEPQPIVLRIAELEPVVVRGDRAQLSRIVVNLIENARGHAATEVTVAVRRSAGSATLVVTDDGPGVPEADRARIFERFIRLDSHRARPTPGSGAGLGLAIVAELVGLHGGSVTVGGTRGAVFTVRLPAVLIAGDLQRR